ncbi:hypothetical protein AAFN60_14150 [Roseibacillus persicicus]|uniref:hypothetical protein n=1 Tax=Roseibacillus persicicus TaxID=454148 RepID=UPI00398A84CB
MQNRRTFIESLSFGSAGIFLSTGGILTSSLALANDSAGKSLSDFDSLSGNLLADWVDGMLAHQIDEPDNPIHDGALACPSCEHIHGRCWEAVYPFLRVAKTTGDEKYLAAAIKLFDWSKNVSGADGRWTNDLNPKSWHGTSIFGAIALAEAIQYHGDLLSEEQLATWKARLEHAASDYLWKKFKTLNFTNVNYGFTAVHGFDLLGRVLGEQKYLDRSSELASGVKEYFTEPNKLLFGEGKPYDVRSTRNLLPVDLGYNVEESLNGVTLYALHQKDEELLRLLQKSLEGHLQFMLPDGGWDNSWGTRQFKWTYWGSRTCDGCQPAFAMMAHRNPALGTAAVRSTDLLARCTANGLLHGGPHYVSHGVSPCIHHTFAHAKTLAFVQDHKKSLEHVDDATPLPREVAKGVKHFPEIAVSLAAKGPWRATVSAYDSIYRTKSEPEHILHATGGSLSVLYHEKVGLLLAGSMPKYLQVEPLNQQENPGGDFPLTPRIEIRKNGKWFTNLYDLTAKVTHEENEKQIRFHVQTTLTNLNYRALADEVSRFDLEYLFEENRTVITAQSTNGDTSKEQASLILPVLSPTGEAVKQVSETRIEISKPNGIVVIESTVPLTIQETKRGRVFNMVPGAEAVPIIAQLPRDSGMRATCTITVL